MDKKRRLLILAKEQYGEFDIKGQSFRYNQWCNNGNFENTDNWYVYNGTLSVSNNIGKYTITTHVSWNAIEQNITAVSGHKYFISFNIKASRNTKCYVIFGDIFWTQYNVGTTETKINVLVTPTTSEKPFMINVNPSDTYLQNGDYVELSNIMVIDMNDLGLNSIGNVSDFFNTDIGKAIQSGFYIPYSQTCAIYNASTPFDFVYKTFEPTTDFELRGIGNAQDIYQNTTGIITRKIGVVDLGTLTWFSEGDNWYGQVPNAKGKFGENGHTQLCAKYKNADDLSENMTCRFDYTSININIHDTTLVGLTGEQVAEALSGVLLYYELDSDTTASVESVSLKKTTNKCYDKNGLELDII